MRLYFNLNPSRAHLREAARDPKTLGHAVFFTYLLYVVARDNMHGQFILNTINIAAAIIWGIVLLSEIGLATIRHEAVKKGFQRPLPPRYGAVFERMLSGFGIYIYLIALGCLLLAFLPGNVNDGLDPFLFAGRLVVLGLAWYGITYSTTRYKSWYEEIWDDGDDNGGNWDDELIPDPTPQDHRAL